MSKDKFVKEGMDKLLKKVFFVGNLPRYPVLDNLESWKHLSQLEGCYEEMRWIILTILGGRIIRSLILVVERNQELFRRRSQRQKWVVRDLGLVLESGYIKWKNRVRPETRYQGCRGSGIGRWRKHQGHPLQDERISGKMLVSLVREIHGYDKNWGLEE